MPTDNAELANGAEYITKDVNNLTYYTKTADQPDLTLSTLAYETQYNLRGVELDGVQYNLLTNVEANPGNTTQTLSSIKIGGVNYAVGGGANAVTTDTDQIITGTKTIAGKPLKFRTSGNAQTSYGGQINSTSSGNINITASNNGDTSLILERSSASLQRFYPSDDNAVNLGDVNIPRRFKDLCIAGNITDGTNSIAVANIATKYTNTDNNITISGSTINLNPSIRVAKTVSGLDGKAVTASMSTRTNPEDYNTLLATYQSIGDEGGAYEGYQDSKQLQVGTTGVNVIAQVQLDPNNQNFESSMTNLSISGYGANLSVDAMSTPAKGSIETFSDIMIGDSFIYNYTKYDYSQVDPENPESEPTVIVDKQYNVLADLDLAESSVQLTGNQAISGTKTFNSNINIGNYGVIAENRSASYGYGINLRAKADGQSNINLNFNNTGGGTGVIKPGTTTSIDLGTSAAKFRSGYFGGELASASVNPTQSLANQSSNGAYYDKGIRHGSEVYDTEYKTFIYKNAIRVLDTSEYEELDDEPADSTIYNIGIPLMSGSMVVAVPPTTAGNYVLKCTRSSSGAISYTWVAE